MSETTFKGSSEYVASEELLSAVNIAMTLQKPLLLKGEPGYRRRYPAEIPSRRICYVNTWQNAS